VKDDSARYVICTSGTRTPLSLTNYTNKNISQKWLFRQQKAFSFWGASLQPGPLTRGSAPWPRWRHSPQTSNLSPLIPAISPQT